MPFITTWTTTAPDETITIPCGDIGTYNATIDWGDAGPTSAITTYNDADLTHTYAVADTYTVSITGTLPWVHFNNAGDRLKIKSIEEWGDVGVLSGAGSYYGCANLVSTATDTPDMSAVTDMSNMLRGTLFNQNIGGWNVSSVENMSGMFAFTTPFNQDLSPWDVSSVKNMNSMFRATSFDQNIGPWDVSSVENMGSMFYQTPFNQNIGPWDVSSVNDMAATFAVTSAFDQDISSWDVSSVLTFNGTFFVAVAFNQDISPWNVSSAVTMASMFWSAVAFDQDLNAWDMSGVQNVSSMFRIATAYDRSFCGWDISSVTDISDFLFGITLSTANYDKTLIAWAALDVTNGLTFNGGSSEYCFGADAHTSLEDDQLWVISDGGLAAGACTDPGPCSGLGGGLSRRRGRR